MNSHETLQQTTSIRLSGNDTELGGRSLIVYSCPHLHRPDKEFDCILLSAPASARQFCAVGDHFLDSGQTTCGTTTVRAQYEVPLAEFPVPPQHLFHSFISEKRSPWSQKEGAETRAKKRR
jgi:hypothetical protein